MNPKKEIHIRKIVLKELDKSEKSILKILETLEKSKYQLWKEISILNKIQDKYFNKLIEKYIDWLYIKQDWPYEIVFDGWKWFGKDNLLWNIDWLDENWQHLNKEERIKQVVNTINQHTKWLVIFANFKEPANNILEIDGNYPILARYQLEKILKDSTLTTKWWNIWFYDTVFINNAQKLANDLNRPITLTWAVADCAAITTYNKKTWTASITHAGREGIVNGVLETLIKKHKTNWDLKDVQFNLSPMAWVNYEWDIDKFYQDYKKLIPKLEKTLEDLRLDYRYGCTEQWYESMIINCQKELREKINLLERKISFLKFLKRAKEEYQIDFLKDKIIVPYKNHPEDKTKKNYPNKWHFYLDRLIKVILTKLWVPEENIHFTKDENWNIVYTTDLNNKWQSYRIHSLWKAGNLPANWTVKAKNWIIYDARNIATITIYPFKK